MSLIRQYNKFAQENPSDIQKALTAAAGVGNALIPEHLEQVITNALPRLSPTVAMMTPKYDAQEIHQFNRLTALPGIGGAMGESAVTPVSQPNFTRATVTLKVIRRKGSTTNFLIDTAKKNVDAAATNLEACILSHLYDLENYTLFGNATANPYEYSGWDHFITTNRINKAIGGTVATSLAEIDTLLDNNLARQGESHKKAFIMSPYMLSKFSQLLTNVRLNQGLQGSITQVDVGGGWRLNAYRDVPIIVSGSCRPGSTMGVTVPSTAVDAGTPASIPDATTRYFRVAGVTRDGEEISCAEINQLTGAAGGNDNYIQLVWPANVNAYRYKIYVGTATGVLLLRAIIPGFTYNANGTITGATTSNIDGAATVGTYTSDANGNVTTVRFNSDPNVAKTSVPVGLQSDTPLVQTGGISPEYLWMIDLDEFQGMGRLPYTNQGGARFNGLVTIKDLAETDDWLEFLIKSYCAVADSFEATSSVIRGLRVS